VDFYRTPPSVAEALLTPAQLRALQQMKAIEARGMSLRQLAAQVGLSEAPDWLTTRSRERKINGVTLARFYPDVPPQSLVPRPGYRGAGQQPREVTLDIQKVTD